MSTIPAPPRMSAPSRSAAPATPAANRPKLGRIDDAVKLGHRIIVNAVEGWGKTSMLAHAPKPAIIMTKGETGYATLLHAGRVPSVDVVNVDSWLDLLGVIDDITASADTYETLGIDALGGAERLCHEAVCARDFKNDWGDKGFSSFQRGYDVSVTEWNGLLARLDKLRAKGTNIIILGHTRIKPYKNPTGADFDRFVADCHDKTWVATHRWADAALFGQFVTVIDKEQRGKGKGIGGTDRVVYTEHRDAFDAKNRYGMPESIDIPDNPAEIYSTIFGYINTGKEA